jgi:hypothetical protein
MRSNPNKFERTQPLTEKIIYVAAVSLISTLVVLSLVSFL